MNKIIWKDIDSTTIKGLIISELPPITKPKMRIKETEIDGVDGSIIEELGYETYDKSLKIGLTRDFDINEVIKYFSGTGQVVFSNEPDKYYNARIIEQVDYERLLRFREATIRFRVQPFKYEYQEESSLISESSENLSTFTNLCNITNVLGHKFSSLLPTDTNANFVIEDFDSNSFSYLVTSTDYLIGVTNNIILEPNTNYTLSLIRSDNGGSSYRNFIYDVAEDGTYTVLGNKIGTGEIKMNFTTGSTGVISLGLGVGNNSTGATGTIKNIMIVEGSTVSNYVPYGTWLQAKCINKGNYFSKPIITIKGTGTIELIVNNNKLFSYKFPNNETQVIVDSEKQDAYLGTLLKNRNMSGEFPILEVGENNIGWNGEVESIEISQKSRWL